MVNTKKRDKKTLTAEEASECGALKRIFEKAQESRPELTQDALSEAMNYKTQGAVSHYLNGSHPLNLKVAAKFARELRCSVEEFSPRLAALLPSQSGIPEGHVRIPVLDLTAQAGHGSEPEDYPAVREYLDLVEGYVRNTLRSNPDNLRILPARGDSMAPTIQDGDLLFVDTGVTHFDEEGIYVIVWAGALLVKRLTADYDSRRIEIRSDNAVAYPSKLVPPERMDELSIRGKVRSWWSLKKY